MNKWQRVVVVITAVVVAGLIAYPPWTETIETTTRERMSGPPGEGPLDMFGTTVRFDRHSQSERNAGRSPLWSPPPSSAMQYLRERSVSMKVNTSAMWTQVVLAIAVGVVLFVGEKFFNAEWVKPKD